MIVWCGKSSIVLINVVYAYCLFVLVGLLWFRVCEKVSVCSLFLVHLGY